MMSDTLTEAEMREALFGGSIETPAKSGKRDPQPASVPKHPSRATAHRSLSPKLRVTLHVTKIDEGPVEVFVHMADTLSTLVAEVEAKAAAKKKKFRYFELISVESA
jgi:hypothetical protein